MLRLYLLQNLYDLSDEATAAEAIDSRAFSDFCGIDSSNQGPDGDTLGRFRNLLIKNSGASRNSSSARDAGASTGRNTGTGSGTDHSADAGGDESAGDCGTDPGRTGRSFGG